MRRGKIPGGTLQEKIRPLQEVFMPLRLTRGDLGHFPADVYVLSTSGALSAETSSAMLTIKGLQKHLKRDLKTLIQQQVKPRLQAGEVKWVQVDDRLTLICALAPTPKALTRALEQIHDLLEENPLYDEKRTRRPRTVAFPAIGTGVNTDKMGSKQSAEVFRRIFENCFDNIVIVAWTQSSFQDFLDVLYPEPRADLERLFSFAVPPEDPEDDKRLASFLNCVASPDSFLFVGSGFSFNAVPGMPSWPDLFDPTWLPDELKGEHLKDEKNKRKLDFLPDYAQIAADLDEGVAAVHQRFLSTIKEKQESARPGFLHYHLLGLPWRAIITTNYDTLIEDTLDRLNIPCTVVTSDQELAKLPSCEGVPVVKIHGGLRRSEGKLTETEIVATRDEYDRFFEARPALASWLEAQLMTSRGVIVGYSISDPHLRHLFARIGRTAEPRDTLQRLFCISFEESPIPSYWQRRGMEILVLNESSSFEPLVNGSVVAAWKRLNQGLLPTDHIKDWAPLMDGLNAEQRATLVTALANAGVEVPATILATIDLSALGNLRSHISPEQADRLKKMKEEKRSQKEEKRSQGGGLEHQPLRSPRDSLLRRP